LQTLRANGAVKFEKIGAAVYYDYEYIVGLLEGTSKNSKGKRKN